METAATDNAEVDQKGKQTSQYCLGLPTVLRRILEELPTDDLIEFSLVNKLWNFEARSVMRERRNLRANIYNGGLGGRKPCERLAAFASDLKNMQVVPFAGLHFAIYHPFNCKSSPDKSFHAPFQVILERLQWKHLSVQFFTCPDRSQECPALLFVKQVLKEKCGVLEELLLGFGDEQFLGPIFQHLNLPCLKSLAIDSYNRTSDSLTSTIAKKLATSAPNLGVLQVSTTVDVMLNILELKPKFTLRPLFRTLTDGFVHFVGSDEMEMFVQRDEISVDMLHRFIPKLLKVSRPSLKTLRMDLLFVLPLMCYGVCLENVTALEIHMNSCRLTELEPAILELPRGLDFTRVFPKMTQVRILDLENTDNGNLDFSSRVISAFAEQGTKVMGKAFKDRATNIKLLDLERCGAVEDSTLILLAKMFPEVKTVHTKRQHQGAMFEDLWEHFLCLEDVTESDDVLSPLHNNACYLDCLFDI